MGHPDPDRLPDISQSKVYAVFAWYYNDVINVI